MRIDANHPLDKTHEQSVKLHAQLMGWFDLVKAHIAVWEPRPVPEEFK
jgi:hypothetical protein